MGFRTQSRRENAASFDLVDVLEAAQRGDIAPTTASGPRARRRAMKAGLAETGLVAALLGVEGCLPITAKPRMTAPDDSSANAGAGSDAAQDAAGAVPDDGAAGDGGASDASGGATDGGDTVAAGGDAPADSPASSGDATSTDDNPAAADDSSGVVQTGSNGGGDTTTDTTQTDTSQTDTSGGMDMSGGTADDSGGSGGMDMSGGTTDDSGGSSGMDMSGGSSSGGMDMSSVPHDASMQAEMAALMALVPTDQATHVAVKNGSWFDPSTWANGQVPGDDAKVHIPQGVTVTYDGQSNASLFTVRVDGELDFATHQDTHMVVDTMVVTPTGHLTIGTLADPVDAGVQAVITIADNGPIDVNWDPMLLSRGLVSHGQVDICGAEKENFVRLAVDPMAGDTTLVLDAPPTGWQVGDSLVLTGTHYGHTTSTWETDNTRTEDEELIITAINGNTITVDRPLQYDHEGADSSLKAYVADFTRNVVIESEFGDNTPTHERGHVMFMHNDNIDVRYAEFMGLGRTDKSVRAFDVGDLATVNSDSNVKGRYALHIHRAGVADLADPAVLVGNAVWGSPGWGIVQHDSNALISGNAVYDVFGAAYSAETGNETGRWSDNIAIKSIGVDVLPKDGADVAAFDLGREGSGFWFQGRLIDVVDNVAAGMPMGHGFIYMSRMPMEDMIPIDPSTALQSDKLRYADDVPNYIPNIGEFSGNEAIAARFGLEVIKPTPLQGHDVRSVIEDFTAWEVWTGISLEYTGHYTITNADLTATQRVIPGYDGGRGIYYDTNVFDTAVNSATIDGFETGVMMRKESVIDPSITDFRYIFVDANISGAANDYVGLNSHDQILTSADLSHALLSYQSAYGAGVIDGPDSWTDNPLYLDGMKTDSIGTTETSTGWDPYYVTFQALRGAVEQHGYWVTPDGRNVTLVEEYVADRATGDLEKFSLWVEVPSALGMTPGNPWTDVRVTPQYNGVLDFTSSAPTAVDDSFTVHAGQKVILDVLANDSDPDGDVVSLDGVTAAKYGLLVDNHDGTLTYIADPNHIGADSFYYWAEDEYGNFTKAQATVTIEA